jgi:hypothetical protein
VGINIQRERSSKGFMSHRLRSIQDGEGSFQIIGSRQSVRTLSLCVHIRVSIRQSPKEAKDHPSSIGIGGVRSTTLE